MIRRVAIALLISGTPFATRATFAGTTLPQPEAIPSATPVITVDDTRTDGPTARDWIDLGAEPQWISGQSVESVQSLTEQLTVGLPELPVRELRDILAPFAPYELRVRTETFHSASGGFQQGPLTVGLQRYFAFDAVAISPLLFAHLGVEIAASTPWLSGRFAIPPTAVRVVDAVDTEIAQNGWSLRPFSAYARADFLACGSRYLELGAAPELFVPTVGQNEYDLRFHIATGWSWGCAKGAKGLRPKLSFEYRGRVRMHQDQAPVAYWDSLGLGVEFDLGSFVIQPLASTVLAEHAFSYGMLGVRFQLGSAKGGS
jgi:hypothetical protein